MRETFWRTGSGKRVLEARDRAGGAADTSSPFPEHPEINVSTYSGFHCRHQCRVVFRILVRIGKGELADGVVEGVGSTQVAADQRRIPGFRVGVGRGPTAQLGVQHVWSHLRFCRRPR